MVFELGLTVKVKFCQILLGRMGGGFLKEKIPLIKNEIEGYIISSIQIVP